MLVAMWIVIGIVLVGLAFINFFYVLVKGKDENSHRYLNEYPVMTIFAAIFWPVALIPFAVIELKKFLNKEVNNSSKDKSSNGTNGPTT